MWLMLSVGLGILMVLYSREWFARFGNLAPPVEDVSLAAPGLTRFVSALLNYMLFLSPKLLQLPQGWLGFVVPHSLPKSWYPHFKFW